MRTPLSTYMLNALMQVIGESRNQADHFRSQLEDDVKKVFEETVSQIPLNNLSMEELRAKLNEMSEVEVTEFLAKYTQCQTVITDIYDVYVNGQIKELQNQIKAAGDIIAITREACQQ